MEKEKGGQLKDFFPFWEKLTAAEMESICRSAAEMTYSRGSFIHKASEDCVGVILVQAGALRVYIQSEDGRDITLFRIEEGEACILSASCFMQEITFEILIDAEEDSRVTVIPVSYTHLYGIISWRIRKKRGFSFRKSRVTVQAGKRNEK